MNFKIFFVLVLFSIISTEILAEEPVSSLKLIVKGLKNDKGVVRIALNNSKTNYDSYHDVFMGGSAKISNNTAEYVFDNIPTGIYAIKVFHDEDNNETLNTNFLGIPVEDYGFSNNAKTLIGIPSWDKAKFTVSTGGNEIIIKIN
ncbi:MAG: hypothetical protein Fur0015_08150 [Ignavibacteriales bacterium]